MNEIAPRSWEEWKVVLDSDGWTRVIEVNGLPREWDNDRIIAGYMTGQEEDKAGDTVHLGAFLLEATTDGVNRMDWLALHGVISLIHGQTEMGFIPLGKILAWKIDGIKIALIVGITKGSEMIDWLWDNYISKNTAGAGFSIGGQNLEKDCTVDTSTGQKKCEVTKLDIWEVAWTPDPAYQGAILTYVNQMAKSGEDFELEFDNMLKGGKVSLKPGQEPPKGSQVVTGPQGGKYYIPSSGKEKEPKEEKPKEKEESKYKDVLSEKEVDSADDQLTEVIFDMKRGHPKSAQKKIKQLRSKLMDKDIPEHLKKKFKAVWNKFQNEYPDMDIYKSESNLIKALYFYRCNDGKEKDREKPTTKSLLLHCKHAQKYLETMIKNGDNYLNTVDSLAQLTDNLFAKGNVCHCLECGFSYLSNENCVTGSCPVCGGDMHAMIRPPLRKSESGNMDDDKKKEDEKKVEKQDDPVAPKEEEEDKEEKKPENDKEEVSLKSLSEKLGILAKSVEANSLLLKDVVVTKAAKADEDTNKLEEVKESPSGAPNPGGDISAKTATPPVATPAPAAITKTEMTVNEAIEIVKKSGGTVNGFGFGVADIKPITELKGPAGVELMSKAGDQNAAVMTKLKFIRGDIPKPTQEAK